MTNKKVLSPDFKEGVCSRFVVNPDELTYYKLNVSLLCTRLDYHLGIEGYPALDHQELQNLVQHVNVNHSINQSISQALTCFQRLTGCETTLYFLLFSVTQPSFVKGAVKQLQSQCTHTSSVSKVLHLKLEKMRRCGTTSSEAQFEGIQRPSTTTNTSWNSVSNVACNQYQPSQPTSDNTANNSPTQNV